MRPVVGNALAVAFVTALGWRLEERRAKWFTELAEAVEQLPGQVDGLRLEALAGSDLFTDAVVTAARTVEHTHRAEKIEAGFGVSVRLLSPGTRDCVEPAQRLRVMASPASRGASMIR